MRKKIRIAIAEAAVGAAVALLGAPAPSLSNMVSVSASPPVQTIPLAQTTGVTTQPLAVRWTAVTTNAFGTITSPRGVFRAGPGGPVLGTGGGTLVATAAGTYAVTLLRYPATLTEVVTVPPALVQRARELGASRLVYERSFTDSATTITGSVSFVFVGGQAGPFQALRVALRFDDGTTLKVVPRGASLSAEAEISWSGTGAVEAVWELADAGSTAGAPIFRPLRRERRVLGVGGRLVLPGPVLPTDTTGLHLVRLRLVNPEPLFEPAVLRYVVTGHAPGKLVLRAPAPETALAADTSFAWSAVEGARVYQLEFFETREPEHPATPESGAAPPAPESVLEASAEPVGSMVGGVALPSTRTEATVPAPILKQLAAGRTYLWRVRALTSGGVTLALSPVRRLRVPPKKMPHVAPSP